MQAGVLCRFHQRNGGAASIMINALRNRFLQFERRTRLGFAFLACAALYAIAGTVFASLLAWFLIVIGTVGIVIVSMAAEVMNDPEKTFGLHSIVALGVGLLVMVPPAAIGFVVAPFVGAWVGWKSAAIISIAMATVWTYTGMRRHAIWLSIVVGAAGAIMTPIEPFDRFGSTTLTAFGVHASAAVACFLVTLIVRDWLAPTSAGAVHPDNRPFHRPD
jgi:hypothetical protein